jgi:hypothetical protein
MLMNEKQNVEHPVVVWMHDCTRDTLRFAVADAMINSRAFS